MDRPPLGRHVLGPTTQGRAGGDQTRITFTTSGSKRGLVTASVVGDIDLSSAAPLRRTLTDVIDAHRPRAIVIDIARVDFLDAAGMTALVQAQRHRPSAGITLVNAQPIVARALAIVGLTAFLRFDG